MKFYENIEFWQYVLTGLTYYNILIFAYVILRIIVSDENIIFRIVAYIVEPYINVFNFAMIRTRQGILDLAPLTSLVVLSYVVVPGVRILAQYFIK